ncbi:MAG TPA: glycosyltransferase [candidate division Zixibacteria bacterium]|nr:glycosyltransferase [candidate division Zixibacteria bacterium]
MKILHLIRSVDPQGGGPIEGVKQISRMYRTMGHSVEIASLDPPGSPLLGTCDVPVHALGPALLKYGYSAKLGPWLRQNLRAYDVFVINGIWQYHGLGASRALKSANIPYVVFTHGMLDPWFKRQYPLKHLKKWLYWPWGEYRVLRDAHAVLFTSEQEKLLARESFPLYRANEVVVGYGTNGPSQSLSELRGKFLEKYPQLENKKLALFLGRVHPKKGCDLLIEAFSKVFQDRTEWHLVIAGPDQVHWQAELERKAASLGIANRIAWTGMLNGDDKWSALAAAEIFVLPSHQENFGIVVAEALACSVPVLISTEVNIWREIEGDGAGIVRRDDLEGTVQLFQTWMQLSEEEKANMRQNARRCFDARFDLHTSARRLIDVLVAVVRREPVPA